MTKNPNSPTSETSPPTNLHPPRRSRPRVRAVSSRFMSPATSTPKHPPLTPAESKSTSVRRSQTDLRPRYGDENRSDSINRSSVSPVRPTRPRSTVKLFRSDTPAPVPGSNFRPPNSETAASKLLRVSGISTVNNNDDKSDSNEESSDDSREESSSIDGDCGSVSSEPHELARNNVVVRVSTPCNRSIEKGGCLTVRKSVKVSRSLKLPPMPPPPAGGGCCGGKETKKAVKKGSSHVEEVHRLKMMHNHYLQWRFCNAKAQSCMINQQKQSEKQLYALGVKISELRDSVKSKRVEYELLKRMKTLSTVLDAQVPYLDKWSTLEDTYSSSLVELSNGLLNVLSQLPLDGNVRANVKEIEEALHSAMKAIEMICVQVESLMPKAENVDNLVSNIARVYSGEISLVDECGDLLSETHLSQVQECSLRGQLMQLHYCKLGEPKDHTRS